MGKITYEKFEDLKQALKICERKKYDISIIEKVICMDNNQLDDFIQNQGYNNKLESKKEYFRNNVLPELLEYYSEETKKRILYNLENNLYDEQLYNTFEILFEALKMCKGNKWLIEKVLKMRKPECLDFIQNQGKLKKNKEDYIDSMEDEPIAFNDITPEKMMELMDLAGSKENIELLKGRLKTGTLGMHTAECLKQELENCIDSKEKREVILMDSEKLFKNNNLNKQKNQGTDKIR